MLLASRDDPSRAVGGALRRRSRELDFDPAIPFDGAVRCKRSCDVVCDSFTVPFDALAA